MDTPFFCGANNVQIGASEIQAILAALAWCHDVNLKAKSVSIRPDNMSAIGSLDRSHRCISHVQLVRATRHCLENARNKWRVNFKHTKAHQGQCKMNLRIPFEDGQLFLSLGKHAALVDGTLVPKVSDTSTDNPRD